MAILSDIPTDIIRDILSRLPVKSLLRFKCISTIWYQLISSQDFIKDHLKQSLSTGSNGSIILYGLDDPYYTVDFDSLDRAVELKPPFMDYKLTSSINGLFLVVLGDNSPIIWNPSTRKHKKLPVDSTTYLEPPRGYISGSKQETYGFGYDTKNDDYKVVKCVMYKGNDFQWVNHEARVYSMKSNTWQKIKKFPYPLTAKQVWGVYVNGALHSHFVLPKLTIIAYHLGDDNHLNVPVPSPNILGETSEIILLTEFEGSLSLVNQGRMFEIDVWVMEIYGDQKSWMKLFSVNFNREMTIFPLRYSKSRDKVLVTNSDLKKLYWYDLNKKRLRNVRVSNLPLQFLALTCVESLVSVEVDVLKKQDKPVTKKPAKKRDDFLSQGFNLVL